MKLSNESIAAIEALAPDEFELFENLIRRTNFLRAFEHILKAREYLKEWDEREPKKLSWQAKKKRREQVDALDIPEGYVCVHKWRFAYVICDHAHHIVSDAVRDLYHMKETANTLSEQKEE